MLGAEDVVVRSLTLDQIKEAGWKLQLKEEEKKVEYTGQYELKKLGDIFNVKGGKAINKVNLTGTKFPYYGCNGVNGYVDEYLFDGEYIICAQDGSIGSVYMVNEKFYPSNHTHIISTKDSAILINQFGSYYLKMGIDWKPLITSIIPKVTQGKLLEILIPLPPLPIQQEIVATLDRIFADPQDMKDCLAFTDKAMDLMLKDPSGKLLEDVMDGLRLKRSHLVAAASIKAQMAAVMRSVGARGYEKKKLGDICEFNTNIQKHDTSFGKETGAFPFYTGAMNNKLFTDTPDIKHPVIIMNRTNGAGKCNLYIDTNCAVAGQTIVFYMKDKNTTTLRYLYYYLNTYKTRVEKGYIGSNHKNMSNGFMEMFLVELPPLPVQQGILTMLNEMEAELKVMEQMAEKAEKRVKFILNGYLSQPTVASVE
jgi:type I restriction enzyme S subunit